MSNSDLHNVTSLLPVSRVQVFSDDKKTLKASEAISDDWRFARVDVEVVEGDIDTAITSYKSKPSPDLVIIQTKTIDETLTEKLGSLSEYCDEDTAAIIIGPKNDVNLYRELIDMGVSDYLVTPLKPNEFTEIVARTLVEKLGAAGSTLITFIGAKGGVGASTMAQAAAWTVSDVLGQKALLIDASGGWSSHGIGLGFEPSTTLAAAAKAAEGDDDANLQRMIIHVSDKLDVLGSGGDVMLEQAITGEQMEHLTSRLMTKYPAVIADLSGATPEVKKALLMQAGRIAVVATPFVASLRQTRALIQEILAIRDEAQKDISLIINMSGLDKSNEVSLKDIQKAMELEPSAIVDFAANIFMKGEIESKKVTSTNEGKALVEKALVPFLKEALGVSFQGTSTQGAEGSFVDKLMSKLKG